MCPHHEPVSGIGIIPVLRRRCCRYAFATVWTAARMTSGVDDFGTTAANQRYTAVSAIDVPAV